MHATSIEAIYILLGPLDLSRHQDLISFDKLTDMAIGPVNKALGRIINTPCMPLMTSPEFIVEVHASLSTMWGPHCKSFTQPEINISGGKLNHMPLASPWLKFLLAQVYVSITSTL
jgi:hypothetical protein